MYTKFGFKLEVSGLQGTSCNTPFEPQNELGFKAFRTKGHYRRYISLCRTRCRQRSAEVNSSTRTPTSGRKARFCTTRLLPALAYRISRMSREKSTSVSMKRMRSLTSFELNVSLSSPRKYALYDMRDSRKSDAYEKRLKFIPGTLSYCNVIYSHTRTTVISWWSSR